MRKIVLTVVSIILMLSFASCNLDLFVKQEPKVGELVSVTFKPYINETKAVSAQIATADTTPSYYQYLAVPVSKSSMVKGSTGQWETLTKKSGSSNEYETAKCFSLGEWTFSIRAMNSKGGLIYQGESGKVLLTANDNNSVSVDLIEKINTETTDSGTVKLRIAVPHLVKGGNPGTLSVELKDIDNAAVSPVSSVTPSTTSTDKNADEYIYNGSYTLAPGLYIVKVNYSETQDGKTVTMSSSITGFRVIEKTETLITGSIEESLYASVNVVISSQKKVSGSLSVTGPSTGTYTAEFTANTSGANDLIPTKYLWYVDGEAKTGTDSGDKKTSTLSYTPGASYGYHSITCIAVYKDSTSSSVFSATKSLEVKNQ